MSASTAPIPIHFRVTLDQRNFLKLHAQAAGISDSQLIRQVLQDWIDARDYDVLQKALQEKDQELTHRLELHRDVLILTRSNYQLAKEFSSQWHRKVFWWHWLRNLFSKPWNAGGGLQRPEAKE